MIKNLEEAQTELEALHKKISGSKNKKFYMDKGLTKGKVYGTAAKNIYENCCTAFGWDKSESRCFGWRTPNFSNSATPEGYSVWFLAHSNWTDSSTQKVKNKISETFMEQWWENEEHPKATARKRVIFAKRENVYLFLGLFVFEGSERVEIQDGKSYYVERFNLVSEHYPD